MRERNIGINIRVTESEKNTIADNARKCNLTVSEYLRKLAMGHEPVELPKGEIYEEMIELDDRIKRLLNELIPKDDEVMQQRYRSELQNVRDIMTRIWRLLLSNFDRKRKGKNNGND